MALSSPVSLLPYNNSNLIRQLAYVSNKRITRILSDVEIDKSELNTDGNEKYIDTRLKNRNPRNLEQMLLEPKPMGYDIDKANHHYWNKVVFENHSRYLVGKIVHHSDKTLLSVSTNDPTFAMVLGKYRAGQKAALILGQVLAIRALEAGIHSVFCEIDINQKGKISTFVQALASSGLNLTEQRFIFRRAPRDH